MQPNGGGKGGSVFTDYNFMLEYLKKDGRRWYVAELNVLSKEICFNMGTDKIATLLVNRLSKNGFSPLEL